MCLPLAAQQNEKWGFCSQQIGQSENWLPEVKGVKNASGPKGQRCLMASELAQLPQIMPKVDQKILQSLAFDRNG